MNDLTRVQPVTSSDGKLMALVGLDGRGNVWYGRLTGKRDGFDVSWARMEETVNP